MNVERSSPQSATQTFALAPVDGTHNRYAAPPSVVRPHTDESITPDRLPPLRTPLKQGALLLAIYVGMYTVTGLLVEAAEALARTLSPARLAPVRDDGAGAVGAVAGCWLDAADVSCARA